MKRENLQRFLFVSAACLLSFPWLTPCVGLMSSAMVDVAHDSISNRNRPLERLSNAQLKAWAEKPGPKLRVIQNTTLPPHRLIKDEELSAAKGGREAPLPGSVVEKSASGLVDGVATTLALADPITWASGFSGDMLPARPSRHLVLSETPFVLLEGRDLRLTRAGKNGPILLAKATYATVTIITPDGKTTANATHIHFDSTTNEIVLEGSWSSVESGGQRYSPKNKDELMTLNWSKRRVSCSGTVDTDRGTRIIKAH